MGRSVAIVWHALFSAVAGFLYFFFVLPRWHELMGDTGHALGTALRIVTGALIALAALPVVFTLLRTRRPEFGTPQLALSLRLWSIVGHVLAGVLIIGAAISEIWLSLDAAGRYLFGIYGAAAAIAVLGIFGFYLSFVAELPPPPPKPIKAKKPKKRREKKRATDEADEAPADAADEAPEDAADEADEADDESTDVSEPSTVVADTEEAEELDATDTASADTAVTEDPADEDQTDEDPAEDSLEDSGGSAARLRNRRPTGKGSHRVRRRRTRGSVALDEE